MGIVIVSFLVGLVVGSFLNVVILRGSRNEGFGGRSRCEGCGRGLWAMELIPIVSFCIQKGRCRSCGIVLLWQEPLVELATALAYAAGVWILLPQFSLTPFFFLSLLKVYVAIAALVVITVSDLQFEIIPDGAVIALFLAGIVESAARHNFFYDWVSALVIALFFASLWAISRGHAMGFGDAKLVLATSLIVGFPADLVAFLFSFWLGGIAAVLLLLLGKKSMQSRLPFGPFIIAGGIGAYFFSQYFLSLTGLKYLF